MTPFQLSVLEDRSASNAGGAIIRISGVRRAQTGWGVTLQRETDGAFLGRAGWEAAPRRLEPKAVHRNATVDLLIPPDLARHVAPGTRLRVEVFPIEASGVLSWPRLGRGPSLGRPADAIVLPGPGRRAPAEETRRAPQFAPPSSGKRPRGPVLAAVQEQPARPALRAVAGAPAGGAAVALRAVEAEEEDAPAPRLVHDRPEPRAAGLTAPVEDSPKPSRRGEGEAEPSGRGARAHRLPWTITGINLGLMACLGIVSFVIVTGAWDPMASDPAEPEVIAEAAPEADARPDPRLDALAALVAADSGPVDEARVTLQQDEDPAQILAHGRAFLQAGESDAARALIEYAAIRGDGAARRMLGRALDPLHFNAEGGLAAAPDPGRAVDWYLQAREAGDLAANADIANLREWLESAAANGNAEAQGALALFFGA